MKMRKIIPAILTLALILSFVPAQAASVPAKVSNVHKISSGPRTAKIGWNKAKNAKQYQVYVSTAGKNGKYKKVKTTTNRTYTIKSSKEGQSLWVKVRGINGKKTGKFSNNVNVVTGKSKVTPEPTGTLKYASSEMLESYRQNMMQFSTGRNFVYSPVSLNTTLKIYKAYYPNDKGIDKFTGNRDYLSYKYPGGYYKSINRIWVNKDKNVSTPQSVKKYEYRISMKDSKKATEEKNKYVTDNTNGFINGTPTVLDSSVDYDIMNITYFKDTWENGDLRVDSKTTKFNNKTNVNMMSAKSGYYYENATAYMIPVNYSHGNRMLLIYPKNGINNVDLSDITKNRKNNGARIKFPPFKTSISFNPNNVISGLHTSLSQTVKIEVNEKGTEAAAVSEAAAGSAAPSDPPLNLTFDKPFLYAIEDTTNGDIAFIGMLSSL